MLIEIENRSDACFSDDLAEVIKKVVEKSIAYENFPKLAEISVTIVNDNQIEEINFHHRNIKSPTDVLSFPMLDFLKGEKPPAEESYILGDIVISIDRAKAQAVEYNHSIEREIGFLTAHSMLHLMGYDHMEKDEEKIMLHKQKDILNSLGLFR